MTLYLQLILLFLSANTLETAINSTFYQALYSDSLITVDAALEALEQKKSSTTINAYKGGLMMKRSDFLKSAAQKIEIFKKGHQLLELAITKSPQNAEYRFIRLAIQEHAPKILKYNKNIEEDKSLIIKSFSSLDSKTRSYILDYAQQSKILTIQDFK
ncbi:hypothetical protein [Aureispira anguillae]|uniref:DUF4142 domain-containing protein n=1 Tax=Aureispira anguillae TaxID=2864201 RepID=A0A915YIT2_9BACT|nr:hypothetical protein [Aureispira anguillae]BDS13985.1 hypothetical protein AsAng_0047480 [Aureispira anguillae]